MIDKIKDIVNIRFVIPYDMKKSKKFVFICSPYAGNIEINTKNAIAYCVAEIESGEVPFAPHLLYPQILSEETDRELGIYLGIEILKRCDEIHVYGNKITDGMREEIRFAFSNRIPAVFMDNFDINNLATHPILQ